MHARLFLVIFLAVFVTACRNPDQDVAQCQLDTEKTFPGKTADICADAALAGMTALVTSGGKGEKLNISGLCHDAGGHMDLCMRTHGYSFSFAHKQCQPSTTVMYNSYCYRPTGTIEGKLWDIEAQFGK